MSARTPQRRWPWLLLFAAACMVPVLAAWPQERFEEIAPRFYRPAVAPLSTDSFVILSSQDQPLTLPPVLWSGRGAYEELKPPEDFCARALAAPLGDGRVLILRADQGEGPATWTFAPIDRSFTQQEPPPIFLGSPVLTLLTGGGVLVTGGVAFGEPPEEARQVALYTVDDRWQTLPPLSAPRVGHTATRLADGRVLIVGGAWAGVGVLPSAEVYDPVARTTTPTGAMSQERAWHSAIVLTDGRVLVVGGMRMLGSAVPPLDSCELWDPSTGQWEEADALHTPRSDAGLAVLPDGRVLAVGGWWRPDRSGLRYYPARARERLFGAPSEHLDSTELYDPEWDDWDRGPTLNTGRLDPAVFPHSGGRVLVIGGEAWEPLMSEVVWFDVPRPFSLWPTR